MPDISDVTGAQLIGILVGALIGYAVSASIAGGSYRYIGGEWWEITEEPMGCLAGCLLEIVAVAIGAAAGYIVGSAF